MAGHARAARPEDAALRVGGHGHVRAEEAHDAGAGEGEEPAEPGSGRARGEVAEEAVPPRAEVAEAHELPVYGQQGEEDGQVGAVLGVVGAGEVGLDVVAQTVLEGVRVGVAQAREGVVERVEVEPVGGVGHGGGDQRLEGGAAGVAGGVLLLEVRPVDGRTVRVGGEEPVVVGEAQLLLDQRPDVAPEVERAGAGEQRVDLGRAEEAGQRGRLAAQRVAELGVVRDAAPRADVQDGLPPGGVVGQRAVGAVVRVAPAAALGEQHHQVDEGQAEAAHDDGLAGAQAGQVAVGGELRGNVRELMFGGEGGEGALFIVGFGVEVAEGEDDEVGEERRGPVREPYLLPPVARPGYADGAAAVFVDGDVRGQGGHRLLVHPAQVRALEPSAGEGLAGQPGEFRRRFGGEVHGERAGAHEVGPFGEGRAGADRALVLDGVVGEHGDVLGHGVHPQQPGLVVPPDPAAAGRVRVHEVDVEAGAALEFGRVGGDPLDDAGGARPGADDHDGGHEGARGAAVGGGAVQGPALRVAVVQAAGRVRPGARRTSAHRAPAVPRA